MSSLNDSARESRRWPMRFLRISLTVTALLMFGQAVLAGLFMGGESSAFGWHREMATVAGISLMVSIVAAILARRLGGAPRWPIWATIALLALMSLLAFAGFRSLTALHVPLAVITILLAAALAVWAWRYRPAAAAKTNAPESDDRARTEAPSLTHAL
ncbi:hypothetical protein [Agromyces cerinus]|uniref:Uncharacterized protein n=1 Tax=Agromyces cerinus subsp. cerinus TaxID=232089 RepID=A0A1N6HM48_9MICO|nr:hypothetical protein [Agromyces cerinus]SIO20715.1 hypothetical protein SAMN05443544_3304 [Agromyces cerinus subsp. cerinus]